MKIVVPGGTGQVGRLLVRGLVPLGHEVVVLSRTPRAVGPVREVAWDARTLARTRWSTSRVGA
jgi:uncharacterized protein YbjT (DUF2867 family)